MGANKVKADNTAAKDTAPVSKPKPPVSSAPVPKKSVLSSKPKPPPPKPVAKKQPIAKKKAVVKNDGIPVLSNWKQDKDGTITGNITNSKMFRAGQKITTSPVKRGAKKGTVVTTQSGSKYRLN